MSCKKTSYLWHLCTTFITEHLNCSVCKTRAIITTPSDPFNSFLPTSLYLLEWEWELCLHSVFLHKMHRLYLRGLKTHIYFLSYLFVKQFFFFSLKFETCRLLSGFLLALNRPRRSAWLCECASFAVLVALKTKTTWTPTDTYEKLLRGYLWVDTFALQMFWNRGVWW